jgi:hypothetical protein
LSMIDDAAKDDWGIESLPQRLDSALATSTGISNVEPEQKPKRQWQNTTPARMDVDGR